MPRFDPMKLLGSVQKILDSPGGSWQGRLKSLCERLKRERAHYHWVGVYWVEGEDLVLRAYAGAHETEHTRIPIGRGICGSAARSGKTEIVGDVTADPRYLACFPSTRSEIVVPIKRGDRVFGEIDIDSDAPEAFTPADTEFLERVASAVADRVAEGENL